VRWTALSSLQYFYRDKPNLSWDKSAPRCNLAVMRLPLTGLFQPNRPATCHLFCNLGLVLTASLLPHFITIVIESLGCSGYCCHGEGNLFYLVLLLISNLVHRTFYKQRSSFTCNYGIKASFFSESFSCGIFLMRYKTVFFFKKYA